jgi:putative oxidoreductase
MKLFRAPSPGRVSLGLLVLRIASGAVFLDHRYQKMLKMGIGGVTGFFGQIGVPLPNVMATLITLLEVFGAIAIIVGFLTRPLALVFVLDMLGAILLVQLKNGFSKYELEFLLLAASLALFLTGAGRYSVDAMIAGRGEPAASGRSDT